MKKFIPIDYQVNLLRTTSNIDTERHDCEIFHWGILEGGH